MSASVGDLDRKHNILTQSTRCPHIRHPMSRLHVCDSLFTTKMWSATWAASCLTRRPPRAQLMKEDDNSWPMPDRVGRQELEIVMGNEHISFTTTKLGSLLQVGSRPSPKPQSWAWVEVITIELVIAMWLLSCKHNTSASSSADPQRSKSDAGAVGSAERGSRGPADILLSCTGEYVHWHCHLRDIWLCTCSVLHCC